MFIYFVLLLVLFYKKKLHHPNAHSLYTYPSPALFFCLKVKETCCMVVTSTTSDNTQEVNLPVLSCSPHVRRPDVLFFFPFRGEPNPLPCPFSPPGHFLAASPCSPDPPIALRACFFLCYSPFFATFAPFGLSWSCYWGVPLFLLDIDLWVWCHAGGCWGVDSFSARFLLGLAFCVSRIHLLWIRVIVVFCRWRIACFIGFGFGYNYGTVRSVGGGFGCICILRGAGDGWGLGCGGPFLGVPPFLLEWRGPSPAVSTHAW